MKRVICLFCGFILALSLVLTVELLRDYDWSGDDDDEGTSDTGKYPGVTFNPDGSVDLPIIPVP